MASSSSIVQIRTSKSFLFGMGCFFAGMAISKFTFAALGSTENTNCPQSAGPFFAATWYFLSFCCLISHFYQSAFSREYQIKENFKLASWQTVILFFIICTVIALVIFHIMFGVKITRSSSDEVCIEEWNSLAINIAEGIGFFFFVVAFAFYSISGPPESTVTQLPFDVNLSTSPLQVGSANPLGQYPSYQAALAQSSTPLSQQNALYTYGRTGYL